MINKYISIIHEEPMDLPMGDSLTGLHSHGYFKLSLESELDRFERDRKPFSLCFIDIDNFTHYNDRFGYAESDRMLKEVGRLIRDNIRETDLAARFGGDQFVVIITDSDMDGVLLVAERLRKVIEQFSNGSLTVSIGIDTLWQDLGLTGEVIIHRAQSAMKHAKLTGKNKIFCFGQDHISLETDKPTILIVDDDPLNRKLMNAMINKLNYKAVTAASGKEAFYILGQTDIDLVLLDIMMPEMDGIEVCSHIKSNEETRMIPVILITGLDDTDIKIKGIDAGADDFITKPPNMAELVARTKSLVRLKKLNNNLASMENVLFSMANTVEAKDQYTYGHVERVSAMALLIGEKMNLSGSDLEALRLGGALHDIGKMGIPGSLINKNGPLNEDEWNLMKKHPVIGYKICLPLKKNLGAALNVVRHHHEKLDGSGYPDGLHGSEISMVARIMTVADMFDALSTDRPYRKAFSTEKVYEILNQESRQGKIDPDVLGCLIRIQSE